MQRVLSGIQPSGSLHLGNLVGAIENYVKLQGEFSTYYMIADWHALTSKYDSPGSIIDDIREAAATFLAAGLDPEQSTLFIQSQVKEHAELHLLFSMITPLSWVERVPTYKEKLQNSKADLGSYGFLGYPVLQAADILVYKANLVPVGEDQLFHLELTREIGRRFNFLYNRDVFPDCQAVLTQVPKVPGLDGRKMSKTYGNVIYLRDTPDQILHKCTRQMASDTARMRKSDPGNPEICTVFVFHKLFTPSQNVAEIAEQCPKAGIGCFECKKRLAEALAERVEPMRLRIEGHLANMENLDAILKNGADKARLLAKETLEEVRGAMGMMTD